jgi:hypothetical protein
MQELGKDKEGKGTGFHPFILEYMLHLMGVNTTDYSSHHNHRKPHKNKVIPKHNYFSFPTASTLDPIPYCLFPIAYCLDP